MGRSWGLLVRMGASLVAALSVTVGYAIAVSFVVSTIAPIRLTIPETVFFGTLLGFAVQLLGIRYLRRKVSPRTGITRDSPSVTATTRRLAQQFDMPSPAVVVEDDPVPNARTVEAPTRKPMLIVTTGLLDTLDNEEVEAVVAHELAHVKNRDSLVLTIAAVGSVTAGSVAATMNFYKQKVDNQNKPWFLNPIGIIAGSMSVLSTVFWVIGRLCIGSLSRYREFVADDAAITATGNPAAFASALRTLTDCDRTPQIDFRKRDFEPQEFDFVPRDNVPAEATAFYNRFTPIHPEEGGVWTVVPQLERLMRTHPLTEQRLERIRATSSETTVTE